jgi:TonB family protein
MLWWGEGMKANQPKFLGSILLSLILLASSYAQERPSNSGVSKASEPPARPIEAAQILGIWASDVESLPFLETYEFKGNGSCEAKAFFSGVRYYAHDGNSIRTGPLARNQPEQVWSAQLDDKRLTLKLSDDLPACPFHRIEGEGSATDALVGAWATDECGAEDWTPASLRLRVQTSNAVYTFTENRLLYVRSRLEDVKPYTLKENGVLCPVFGAKGSVLRFTSQEGVAGLVANGVSKAFVRVTPGDIAFRQYSPGDPTKENLKLGNEAYASFKSELESNPNDGATIEKIAALLFQMAGTPYDPARFEESKKYYKRQITLLANDPDPYYMIGCIDWVLAFRANAEMRRDYNIEHLSSQVRDSEALPSAVRNQYTSRYALIVNEGISNLEKALTLSPDDRDALAYLNLLYRRKADMAESEAERTGFLKQADDLVAKVNSVKKANITSGRMRRPNPLIAPPPPPPPLPPPGSPMANGGVIGGVIAGIGEAPPPPKPTQTRIRQGGNIAAAMLIKRVQPVYPPLALQTRISGTVQLHAIIGKDGTIQQLEVMSGHPLLLQAALDAVRQWTYRQTLLNGEPVEVDTTIDVIFALNNPPTANQ